MARSPLLPLYSETPPASLSSLRPTSPLATVYPRKSQVPRRVSIYCLSHHICTASHQRQKSACLGTYRGTYMHKIAPTPLPLLFLPYFNQGTQSNPDIFSGYSAVQTLLLSYPPLDLSSLHTPEPCDYLLCAGIAGHSLCSFKCTGSPD